jgi:hypothetical protein
MVVAAVAVPAAPAERTNAATGVSGVFIDSEPGESVGEGRQVVYDAGNSSFGFMSGSDESLWVELGTTDSFGHWVMLFAPAPGGTLAVGTYDNAVGGSFPMLSVSHGGLIGCSSFGGWFTIDEYAHDPGGVITALSLTFRQVCQPGGKSLYGEVRYQAANGFKAATLSPTATTFDSALVGDTGGEQAFTLTSAGQLDLELGSVSIAGEAAADYEVAGDCSPGTLPAGSSCTMTVTFAPETDGTRQAALLIADNTVRGERSSALSGLARLFNWGSAAAAGGDYAWNWGHALARTSPSSGGPYLHALYTTNRVGGKWIKDSGPYAGVTYIRSSDGGASWGSPRRINPHSQHGDREAVAASGNYVYVTWVRVKKWVHFKGSDPRALYIRVSPDNGATWKPIKRLTSASGRVDVSSVAASGASVYVAYTNSSTGDVRLAVSRNHGRTWHTTKVGTTKLKATQGRVGLAVVAASGSNVGVAWRSGLQQVKGRVSTNSGKSWKAAVELGGNSDSPTVAAAGSRVVFAWMQNLDLRVRTWNGAWSPALKVDAGGDLAGQLPISVTLALNGSSRIGLAWAGCLTGCDDTYNANSRVGLFWRTSRDGGATWEPRDTLATGDEASSRHINDTPSIDWSVTEAPVVLFNGWSPGTNDYRLYVMQPS